MELLSGHDDLSECVDCSETLSRMLDKIKPEEMPEGLHEKLRSIANGNMEHSSEEILNSINTATHKFLALFILVGNIYVTDAINRWMNRDICENAAATQQ